MRIKQTINSVLALRDLKSPQASSPELIGCADEISSKTVGMKQMHVSVSHCAIFPCFIYLFAEREVLSSKEEEESKMSALLGPNPPSGLGQPAPQPPSYSSTSGTSSMGAYGSLTKVERDAFDKMKAVTNASDAVCTKLLKRCRWKVDEAVNAYYRGDR